MIRELIPYLAAFLFGYLMNSLLYLLPDMMVSYQTFCIKVKNNISDNEGDDADTEELSNISSVDSTRKAND